MLDKHGKLIFPPEFLRKNKQSLISSEQVTVSNIRCPNCTSVATVTEAFTKSCSLDNGIVVPSFDERGVIVGECSNCHKSFAIDVVNPELSDFNGGAAKIDHYFDVGDEIKNESYKNIPKATSKVKGDGNLTQYYVNFFYDEYPLYVCGRCGQNLETSSLKAFKEQFEKFHSKHNNYINWSLSNAHGQNPDYAIAKLNFKCTCGNLCASFFFKKYIETYDLKIEEFSICNIIGSQKITDTILSGVYSKDNSVSWLYKLIPRWTLLFDKVYIITPFIGHQWLNPPKLMKNWLELINRLDHRKSKILLRYGQFSRFKKAYAKENSESYERLSEFDLGVNLLSEIKQTNDFHAKIYCGISRDDCEVFSGSANLVRGKSMEVMHFNKYKNFNDFNKAFLSPLEINEYLEQNNNEYSLFFELDKNPSTFTDARVITSTEYKKIILQNSN